MFFTSLRLVSLMVFLPIVLLASTKSDSLLNEIGKTVNDTAKCNLYYQLIKETFDFEKRTEYIERLKHLSEKSGSLKHLGMYYETDARLVSDTGNPKLCLSFAEKALKYYSEAKYLTGVAHAYNSMGVGYNNLGNYSSALEYYQKSLDLFTQLGNKRMQAGLINNIALIYQQQESGVKAIELLQKAAALNIELNNQRWLAINYGNIAINYFYMKQLDSALKYQNLSLSQHKLLGNYAQIPNGYSTLANIYNSMGDKEKSKYYNKLSLKIADSTGYKNSKPLVLINLGRTYMEENDLANALPNVKEGTRIAEELNQMVNIKLGYELLHEIYAKLGDNASAYKSLRKYLQINDTLSKISATEKLAEIEAKYINEQNVKENELLKEKNRVAELNENKNKTIIYALIFVFILILIFGVFVYKNILQRKKANEMLRTQNDEIILQKNVIEEKNKEINDSINYAKHIQNTLLPELSNLNKLFDDWFIIHKPRNIVSGDFYWFAQRGQQILVAAADCTGHGVPGAFMSMIGIDKLNQSILDFNLQTPADILSFLNMSVKVSLKQDEAESISHDGMDIGLLAYNKQTMTVDFSGANRPLWIIRKNEIIELPSTKAAIAGKTSLTQEYQNHSVKVEKGDVIYVFSDGYADQFGGDKGKKMMTKNFKQLLLSIADKSLTEQKEILDNTHEGWKGELEQVDDILVIGLKI